MKKEVELLIADYRGKLDTIKGMLEQANDPKTIVRLKIKAGCYRTFKTELERIAKEPNQRAITLDWLVDLIWFWLDFQDNEDGIAKDAPESGEERALCCIERFVEKTPFPMYQPLSREETESKAIDTGIKKYFNGNHTGYSDFKDGYMACYDQLRLENNYLLHRISETTAKNRLEEAKRIIEDQECERHDLHELVAKQEEYIKLLSKELNDFSGFLSVQGQQSTPEKIEKGKELREQIAKLKELVKIKEE